MDKEEGEITLSIDNERTEEGEANSVRILNIEP